MTLKVELLIQIGAHTSSSHHLCIIHPARGLSKLVLDACGSTANKIHLNQNDDQLRQGMVVFLAANFSEIL